MNINMKNSLSHVNAFYKVIKILIIHKLKYTRLYELISNLHDIEI